MKIKYFSLIMLTMSSLCCFAQRSAITSAGSIHIDKLFLPANLNIVEGSIQFVDATGDKAVNANETCKICFTIKNTGKGAAYGCTARIDCEGNTQGIHVNRVKEIPTIQPDEERFIEIPIRADMNTTDGIANFVIQVDEPNGFGTDPSYLSVNTRAFVAPQIQVTDFSVTSLSGTTLQKKMPFDLQILVQNTTYGLGENVEMEVILPQNVLLTEGNPKERIGNMKAGDVKSYVYSLVATNNYQGTTIPVQVRLKERYGKYAEDRTIELHINQALASSKIDVKAEDVKYEAIEIASLRSDVDINIPVNPRNAKNTFAVIITNENYTSLARVPYANNDGAVFANYCTQTLGIPHNNVRKYQDATYANMRAAMQDIQAIATAYRGNVNIIFYYAGHGAPYENTKEAYLLPVDAYRVAPDVCYSLKQLYADLAGLQANKVTVFLDACFSGSARSAQGEMLASARGVAISARQDAPQGKMLVLTAATNSETALPYEKQQHGLFTYYLLKKLQETQGNVTMQDLGNYIIEQVSRQSIVINRKSQTPSITPSPSATDWTNWKLF